MCDTTHMHSSRDREPRMTQKTERRHQRNFCTWECMSGGMNVIFRGNGKRRREQEEAAPAEVFSSQATRCAKRDGERERSERKRGSKRSCSSCKLRREGERGSTVEVRDRREKGEKQWKAREQPLLLPKAPCYVSHLHSHELHKTTKKEKREKISSARLVFEIICK